MLNPFAHFWLFAYAVWDHVFTLAAGCVLTVLLNVYEKYGLKGKKIPAKGDIVILLVFLFAACFQAWRDQYEKALKASSTAPTIQVNVPPIVVPPAQVVITPSSTPPAISVLKTQLEGYLQPSLELFDQTIQAGVPIKFNFRVTATGIPVKDVFFVAFPALSNSDAPEKDPTAERNLRQYVSGAIAKQKKSIKTDKLQGVHLSVGNESVFQTVYSPPPDATQVESLLTGRTRFYVLTWLSWEDAHGVPAEQESCQWVQSPASLVILAKAVVWRACMQ